MIGRVWSAGRTLVWILLGAVLALVVATPVGAAVVAVPTVAVQQGATSTYDAASYDAPTQLATADAATPEPRASPAPPGAASWGSPVSSARFGVAANTGADVVLYSPQAASRNLLGQLGEGFATTPGGRTVSAHAADRIVNGAAGRGPTTLSRVDDILNSPTALCYDPLRDTVRVSQGKDFVVVRGSGSGQHIVTVMVP